VSGSRADELVQMRPSIQAPPARRAPLRLGALTAVLALLASLATATTAEASHHHHHGHLGHLGRQALIAKVRHHKKTTTEGTAPAPAPEPAPEPTSSPEPTPSPTPEPQPAPTGEESTVTLEEPASTPEPAPEPIPNPSDLLFSGARIGDFAQIQAAPGAIAEVPDPLGSGQTVLRMTVSDKDVYPITPTDNPRAQALSTSIVNPGAEVWLSTKFMLPADFPSNVPGWMSLVSIYGPPYNGASPWCIGIGGGSFNWQRNGTYNWDVPWEAPMARGRWVTVLLHERFATDGWVEMWIDGNPVKFFPGNTYNPSRHAATEKLTMQTMDSSNNGGANAAKIMQYREAGMFETATVYFGALKLGRTRASVGG